MTIPAETDQPSPTLYPAGWSARWPCTGVTGAGTWAAAARARLGPGEVMIGQGAAPTGVWLVEEGQLEMVCHRGGQKVLVAPVHPGDVVGDIPLLAGGLSPVAVRAVTAVVAWHVNAATFRELLRAQPALARCWMRLVARRQAARPA